MYENVNDILNRIFDVYKDKNNFYENGTCMLPNNGDSYLFIGLGGSGIQAMCAIKDKLEQTLNPDQLTSRIGFLGFDTDRSSQMTRRHFKDQNNPHFQMVIRLDDDQFCPLSQKYAREAIENDESIWEWLDPTVKEWDGTPCVLSDMGASGSPQLGRLSLHPGENVTFAAERIRTIVGKLMVHRSIPPKIIILSGVSGGTGGGLAVDMTYLIRHVISRMNITAGKVYCVGVLLLPSFCGSDDPVVLQHALSHGYAALKEINHFMTESVEDEPYHMQYGNGLVVESRKRIFDACYLLDSEWHHTVQCNSFTCVYGEIAESVLDLINIDPSARGGLPFPPYARIDRLSHQIAPRDADYIYRTLEHQELSLPFSRLKAYTGKIIFSEIKRMMGCARAHTEDANKLIRETIRHRPDTRRKMYQVIWGVLNDFGWGIEDYHCGPYYVLSLLDQAAEIAEQMTHRPQLMRPGFISSEELERLQDSIRICQNHYSDIAETLRGFGEIIDQAYDDIQDPKNPQNPFFFVSDSLPFSSEGEESIRTYLDGLINFKVLKHFTAGLLDAMAVNDLRRWDTPEQGREAVENIRQRWNDMLDELIDVDLEDVLVKYYSGNPNASFHNPNFGDGMYWLRTAAKHIYSSLVGGSPAPMLALSHSGPGVETFSGYTDLLVPDSAPHLLKAIQMEAVQDHSGRYVAVFAVPMKYRISCCKQYLNLPAYKLCFAEQGEKIYEDVLSCIIGSRMHSSRSFHGHPWRNWPNLLPESCWNNIDFSPYFNQRESRLADQAQELFTHGLALGLTEYRVNSDHEIYYDIFSLEDEYLPAVHESNSGEQLQADAERCAEALYCRLGKPGENTDLVRKLLDKGVTFRRHALHRQEMIMTAGPVAPYSAGWSEHMAGLVLRKEYSVMSRMERTIQVMEALIRYIDDPKKVQ